MILNAPVLDPMEHSYLSTNLITRILGWVVSKHQEHPRGPRTLTRNRAVAAHPEGAVVHRIRTRMVMEGRLR